MRYMAAGVIVAIIAGCGGGAPDSTPDDRITNPVDTLRVVMEIGEELGDSTNTFAAIVAATVDEQGRIIVVDQAEACLKVYDTEGNYIRQVSRRGEGPGELVLPWDVFTMPDGRVVVIAPGKQGFVVFDDSLRYLEEISLWQQNPPFYATPISDSSFVGYKIGQDLRDEAIVMRRTVAIYKWGEEDWKTALWRDSMEATMSELMEDPSVFLIDLIDPMSICGNAEAIYFALKDPYDYSITGWDTTGTEILSISRDMTPVEKTPEEMADESLYVNSYIRRMTGGGGGFPFEFSPDPYKYMVVDLDIGPDGNLWVRRGTRREPFFDIYDLQGNLLRHAVFPDDGWSWQTEVTPRGILAWEDDPPEGYQKLYLLE
ncbi:6-bladed beta-propeller [Candidatus Fermentibacteria bacterium]|nr:6-bladed beta-propeller [Candidatus Fermentibacteria bacterium]